MLFHRSVFKFIGLFILPIGLFLMTLLEVKGQLIVDVGTGSLQNTSTSYPAPYGNFYWGAKHQMMIRASELNALGIAGGNLNSLAFFVVTPQGTPLQNFTIKLGTTSDSALSTATGFISNMTQVYTVTSYTEVAGWNTHLFAQPFFWNGSSNLIIETCFNNNSYINNAIMRNSDAGFTSTLYFRQDAVGTCTGAPGPFNFFSSTERSNMRLGFLPLLGTDAAATGLINPVPPVLGGSSGQVIMRLSNYAANTITGATVGYSLNNGAPVTEGWSGSLSTGQSVNHTFTMPVSLPLNPPADLKVWVVNPSPGPDINSGNDTFRVNLCYALPGGVYSVGPGAGAAFPTLQAAVQAIRCGGIAGPVTFELQSGVHYGSYDIANIIGLSASSPLTFTSATGNAVDVVLIQDTSMTGTERSIFKLNNTPHIRFQNLTLRRTMMNGSSAGGTFMTAHILANEADFMLVSGCVFQDSVNSPFVSRDNVAINAENASNALISGCAFNGFATAIGMGSTSGNALNLNQINNNTFAGYLDAVSAFDQAGMLISGNTFEQQRPNGIAALSLNQVSACHVHSNKFSGMAYTTQIRVTNSNDTLSQPTRIYNNAINIEFSPISAFGFNSPILVEGFSDTSTAFPDPQDGIELAFNTVRVRCTGNSSTTTLNYGLIQAIDNTFSPVASPSSPFVKLNIFNNNLYADASQGLSVPSSWSALALETDSIARGCQSNHNNFYFKPVPGQSVAGNLISVTLFNLSFATCSAWTAAYNKDSNSVSLNPVFAGASLSVPLSSTFDNLGFPFGGIGVDISGNTRNATTPDIGAFEFSPAPNDLGVISLVSPVSGCGLGSALPVTVRVANFGTVSQTNFGLGYSLNGGAIVTGSFVGTINPGDTVSFTFSGLINLSTPGTYQFVSFTSLGNDGQNLNDTLSASMVSVPLISAMPYVEDFEASAGGWTSYGTNNTWQHGTPTGVVINTAGGGTQSWTTNLTGDYNNSELSYLESPCLNLSTLTSPQVRFKIWWESENGWDGVQLQYSTDGGATWSVVGTVGSGINWYNSTLTNGPGTGLACWNGSITGFPPGGSRGWLTAQHNLSALAGVTGVKFRFMFISDISITRDGIGIDDFRVSDPPPVEAKLAAITAPNSGCGLPNNAQVSIRVKNQGTQILTNIPVRYRINALAPVAEVMPGPIAPGDSLVYNFNTRANLSVAGTYTLTAYTAVPADADLSNDTLRANVTHIPLVSSVPYSQNFESNNGGWTSGGSNSSWAWGIPTGITINNAASGQRAWVTNLGGDYNDDEESYLQLPCFNFSGIQNATISFSLNFDTEDTYDGANLQYSTNGGLSWQVLGAVGSGTNWYSSPSVSSSNGFPVWDGSSSGWLRASHSLSALNNVSSVLLRFVFTSDGSVTEEGIGIDSIFIGNPPVNVPDIGITQLLTPTTPVLNQDHSVKVVIRNFSAIPITNYLVSYSVNGVLVDANTLSRSIQANDTIHHIFTGRWRPTIGGTHRMCAFTGPVTGQTNNSNDTTCRVFTSVNVSDLLPGGIALYPNPTCDETKLQWDGSMDVIELEWRDAGGRLVNSINVELATVTEISGYRQIRIPVDQWSAGLYYGTLRMRDGETRYLKLMVSE